MAFLSEISYSETRNRDGSTFSRQLAVKVTVEQAEGKFNLQEPVPQLLGLAVDHVVEFVVAELNIGPAPEFETGDKVQGVQQGQQRKDPPKEGDKKQDPPKPSNPESSTSVKCTKCGGFCEIRESVANKGTFYKYCPRCKKNRRKDGTPYPGE